MRETPEDLTRLQELLDASHARSTGHLRSIINDMLFLASADQGSKASNATPYCQKVAVGAATPPFIVAYCSMVLTQKRCHRCIFPKTLLTCLR